MRCGNCGEKGDTAQQCGKPCIPTEERKCLTCGKTGHVARNCLASKANVAKPAPFKPFVGEPMVLRSLPTRQDAGTAYSWRISLAAPSSPGAEASSEQIHCTWDRW